MPVQIGENKSSASPTLPMDTQKLNGEILSGMETLRNEEKTVILEAAAKYAAAADRALLSEESKSAKIKDGERPKSEEGEPSDPGAGKTEKWTLEAARLWPVMTQWQPEKGFCLKDQLDQLFSLYQDLIREVLKYGDGSDHLIQIGRLDQMLSLALNRIQEHSMSHLFSFFLQYGGKEQVLKLKAELYRIATGQRLPQREIERFWMAGSGRGPEVSAPGAKRPAAVYVPFTPAQSQGMIYRIGEGGRVESSSLRGTLQGEVSRTGISGGVSPTGESAIRPFSGSEFPRDFGMRAAGKQEPGHFYTPGDMEAGETFTRHITGNGNLFSESRFQGGSEELTGVVASVMAVKCREFSLLSQMGSAMSNDLAGAVDNFIDSWVRALFPHPGGLAEGKYGGRSPGTPPGASQGEKGCYTGQSLPDGRGREKDTSMSARRFGAKAVYQVYYHILSLYRKHGQPEKAIAEGLRCAIELFRDKREGTLSSEQGPRAEQEGFFFRTEDLSHGKSGFYDDLRAGKKILEEDWEDLMAQEKSNSRKRISLVPMEQSFWAMMMEPEKETGIATPKQLLNLLVAAAFFGVILLACIRFWW